MARTLTGLYYETHGDGIPLFLGFPLTASASSDDPELAILRDYLPRLVDRYRVLVVDYPNTGASTPIPASEFTVDRACADLLAVADAAGFERFAWWGFSWGGVIGLQLAARSDRISALVCGGWPPLGGPYEEVLQACTAMATDAPPEISQVASPFVTFYESLLKQPAPCAATRISCPRMAFVGSEDEVELAGFKIPLTLRFQRHRERIEELGWSVTEVPGRDHLLWSDPDTVVPIVRAFLDRAV